MVQKPKVRSKPGDGGRVGWEMGTHCRFSAETNIS